jgi:hypothetical protein
MYSTLSLKRLVAWLALPPLIIFMLLAILLHVPQNLKEGWSLASRVLSGWGIFLFMFGSGSQWWRPWRLVWRIPGVQQFIFPDLNGKWIGKTRSNWPSVKAMFDAYEKREKPGHAGSLDLVALQDDDIELKITASFFRLRVEGKLSNTGGTSHSISAQVAWNDYLERFELGYLYNQSTPTPLQTDEALHLGSAYLVLDMEAVTLKGEYWTKRSWRRGLNTAGMLEVARV